MTRFHFRFWGVRGSLPSAGVKTVRYGGNTPCLEVRCGDELFIVDMGSGLRAMGQALGATPLRAHVLFTHYHYDHVQGLPFFAPLFDPRSAFDVHGPAWSGRDVRAVLAGQMVPPYFPVGLEIVRAQMSYHEVRPGQALRFGDCTVHPAELHHPGGNLGYRFELEGRTLVYCTDVEHDEGPCDRAIAKLARGADWLIYDAMYTPDEYAGRSGAPRKGFGHSTWELAARAAQAAGAKQLLLCHHDPGRSDDEIDELVRLARTRFPQTDAAREGALIEIV